ncbi:MAG: type II toxin-antitoxin system PemK/MazF family toxin [Planctomycetes bacterium]|nr:type II toxin-antitoxin system PemK/MazF family toxin [Planctomycetota bacterium]MBU1518375.1 type II toxin-antitoxin system PemK/MazF family toxin [Planctomycetota bacterium]MBU2457357.1 type II toxin-antitoxin system PemK/MazF family toxin [Planctomycetota bacterium]MBU2597534.1 type II toxin-antitoxin system PemK/MazF family toxin [Planctomycetota bacterium]
MTSSSVSAGDVVLIIDAPFTNRLGYKPRPALVVSGNLFNQTNPDVFLVPISSTIRYRLLTQIIVDEKEPYFQQTGLKQTSAIKCGAAFAYSQSQIRRKLGNIPHEVLTQVRNILIDIISKD